MGGGDRAGKYGRRAGAMRRKVLRKPKDVLPSPLQLAVLGTDVPCISPARARLRLLGPEQEAEGLHLQGVEAAAAAAGDTCH